MVAATPAAPTTTKPLQPKLVPQRRLPRFGFHTHCERANGRAAMLGFFALLAAEQWLGHGLLVWP
jgi:hypothetical protein